MDLPRSCCFGNHPRLKYIELNILCHHFTFLYVPSESCLYLCVCAKNSWIFDKRFACGRKKKAWKGKSKKELPMGQAVTGKSAAFTKLSNGTCCWFSVMFSGLSAELPHIFVAGLCSLFWVFLSMWRSPCTWSVEGPFRLILKYYWLYRHGDHAILEYSIYEMITQRIDPENIVLT